MNFVPIFKDEGLEIQTFGKGQTKFFSGSSRIESKDKA